MKVLNIVGIRPETIKMAPVIKQFTSRGLKFIIIICIVGKHRQMLEVRLNYIALLNNVAEISNISISSGSKQNTTLTFCKLLKAF